MRRWGADEDAARDAAQEAAARALGRLAGGSAFDSRRGLFLWCLRVARHRLTDEWRVQERHHDPGPVPEQEMPDDLTTAVEWRLALEETARAIAGLTANEQAALVATLTPAPVIEDKRARDREGLRRLRARQRLRAITSGLPVAVPWHRLRSWGRRDWTTASTGLAAATTALVGAAILITAAVSPSTHGHRTQQSNSVARNEPAVAVASLVSATRAHEPTIRATHRAVIPTGLPTPPETTTTTVPVASQQVRVTVPTPNDSHFEAGTRPNHPDKPLVCAETWLTPRICVPKP